jgi:hypothetical protein
MWETLLSRRTAMLYFATSGVADVAGSWSGVGPERTITHFTLWSLAVHSAYLALPLSMRPRSIVRTLHGTSFMLSVSVLSMYLWTLSGNPQLEDGIAEFYGQGRVFGWARSFLLHAMPFAVHMHGMSEEASARALHRAYEGSTSTSRYILPLLSAWGFAEVYKLVVPLDPYQTYKIHRYDPVTFEIGLWVSGFAAFFAGLCILHRFHRRDDHGKDM